MPTQNNEPSIWVRTAPDIDGTYRVSLELDDDDAEFLDATRALEHAQYVLHQACRAEFDAKVYKQIDMLLPPLRPGGDADDRTKTIALLIGDLRTDRIELTPVTRLALAPGVNPRGKPFLNLVLNNKFVGQWELRDARSHATFIIEAVHAADLDAAYLRLLKGTLELSDSMARNVVGDLA